MRTEWTVLLIQAATDFVIAFGTGITAAMMATGMAEIPNKATIIISLIAGALAFARTIQKALSVTPEAIVELRKINIPAIERNKPPSI